MPSLISVVLQSNATLGCEADLEYCIFTFKSTWGVTRDPFYLFDISVQGLAERDTMEKFGNPFKLHKECGSTRGYGLKLDFAEIVFPIDFGSQKVSIKRSGYFKSISELFANQWTNLTNLCVMRDLDQSSGSTEDSLGVVFTSRPSPSLAWQLFTPPITDAEPVFEELEFDLLPSPYLSIAKMLLVEFSLPLQNSAITGFLPAQFFSKELPDLTDSDLRICLPRPWMLRPLRSILKDRRIGQALEELML
ncbi:hypothetical protein C8R45DRAFT_931258 [Mycena sanguinolenta]|nr:hypothetical protein C8R45DRAFT_931258 [Mycena sanguinolenta]